MTRSYKARRRCLDQFEKYDRNIGSLYAYKLSLRIKRDLLNKEYVILQVCTICLYIYLLHIIVRVIKISVLVRKIVKNETFRKSSKHTYTITGSACCST